MKLIRFEKMFNSEVIYLLPVIVIAVNDMFFIRRNLAIAFHFLNFHCKWLWVEEEDE